MHGVHGLKCGIGGKFCVTSASVIESRQTHSNLQLVVRIHTP